MTDLVIPAGQVAGFLLASIRIAGFVTSSPMFGRAIPGPGRVAVITVLGFAFASPVEGSLDLAGLAVAAVVNAGIGLLLGWITGLIFHLFAVAGGIIDYSSGLASAEMFDPLTQASTPIVGRFLNLGALTLFLVLGGDRLLVAGLGRSFDAIGVTGSIDLDPGLATVAVDLVGRLMIAGIELAMPALAALFLAEVVLGIASRFAPQANVFIIGLPAKLLVAFASIGAVVLLVPETTSGVFDIVADTFTQTIAGLTSN